MTFKALEGDEVVLYSKGVFDVRPLFEFEGGLYAQVGATKFIRLKTNNSTSNPNLKVERLIIDRPLWKDPHGRLSIIGGHNRVPL